MNHVVIRYLIARLREPSTWAALSALLMAFGVVSKEQGDALATSGPVVAGAVAGVIAVFLADPGVPKGPTP